MEDKIIQVNTLRGGPFTFSCRYNVEKLQQLWVEAFVLSQTVKDIPVLPHLAAGLEEELIKRSIFGTAAIEGNPLTEAAVAKIVGEPENKDTIKKAEIEIRNLKRMYNHFILRQQEGELLLSEELIKEINLVLLFECGEKNVVPGNYRNYEVQVGDGGHGGVYTPPKTLEDIRTLMAAFIQWINAPEIMAFGPFIRAALAHYYLGRIHPFGDGNGRTSRAVEAMILRASGMKHVPLMLSNYYYRNVDDYFWAFSLAGKTEGNDLTPFIEYFLKGMKSSCEDLRDKMFWLIRKFSLRDYFRWLLQKRDISQRQFDLLMLLLDTSEKITLRDLYDKDRFASLYRKVSERTARRDLDHLKDGGFLLFAEGTYSLNYYALDK